MQRLAQVFAAIAQISPAGRSLGRHGPIDQTFNDYLVNSRACCRPVVATKRGQNIPKGSPETPLLFEATLQKLLTWWFGSLHEKVADSLGTCGIDHMPSVYIGGCGGISF
eukprot:5054808-Amphidinium_carterae.1